MADLLGGLKSILADLYNACITFSVAVYVQLSAILLSSSDFVDLLSRYTSLTTEAINDLLMAYIDISQVCFSYSAY